MLQQTTVATVKPRFERFVERWPTVEALAAASDEEILSEWAGLGYYARARNLIACAREVARRGGFPTSAAELRKLPGIGDLYLGGNRRDRVRRRKRLRSTPMSSGWLPAWHGLKRTSRAALSDTCVRDDAGGAARRFRPGDDGPRRDHLPAEEAAVRGVSADLAIVSLLPAANPKAFPSAGRAQCGRTDTESLIGSSATARSGSFVARQRACLAAWPRLPGSEWSEGDPERAERNCDGSPCLHPFLARPCRRSACRARGRGLVAAARSPRRSGPSDPLPKGRRGRACQPWTDLPPEPFFSGPGLDRADALRADPDALEEARAATPTLGSCNGATVCRRSLATGVSAGPKRMPPDLFLGLDGERSVLLGDRECHRRRAHRLSADGAARRR